MRSIDGHFTVIHEPGTARTLATSLLEMMESVREPEHIIITESMLEQGATRAQVVLSSSLSQSIKKIDAQLEAEEEPKEKVTYRKIDKTQHNVLEATNKAERTSSKRNWRKLDKARKTLAKQLNKSGFEDYTAYADYLNSQSLDGAKRRELLMMRDHLVAQKKQADNPHKSLVSLSPAQVITVIADVLSRAPHTPVGPLPIVIDDALRSLETSTKLRALEVLKAHSTHYATWYVTNDPLVLGWAGFEEQHTAFIERSETGIYNIDDEIAL